jgi:predicted Zn-dependent peptidase
MRHELTTLSNGTRVVLVPHADTAAVTVYAMVEAGSRYETLATNGAAHFIEHLLFKGTTKRPSSMAISRDLDAVGADYNAFTSKDYTGYFVKLPAGKFALATDMLADMLFGSLFRPKDIASERQVINEEIRMYEDNPQSLVEESMEEAMFAGSPLGWRISGTVQTMAGVTRKDLQKFHEHYYVPQRTVLAVAGKFDRAKTLASLERLFGKRRDPKQPPTMFTSFSFPEPAGPRVVAVPKKVEQTQLCLGFPAYGYGHPRLTALYVLSTLLGGTMSSRLFMSVREKKGLAYSIRSSVGSYQDVGDFTIAAGVRTSQATEALRLILKETADLCRKGPTADELHRAKEYIKGKTALALEDSSRLAEWFARQELLEHRIVSPEERMAKVARVTAADVTAAAREVLDVSRLTLGVVGPDAKAETFAKVLKGATKKP